MINFMEEAEKIIKINSVSQNGNEEIAVYLQDLMRKVGFKTSLQEVAHSLPDVSKRQFNVIGILGDTLVDSKTKKGLLLNTHTDTVGTGLRSNWTETNGDPFNATVKGDRIYGLGSADVKLDFLCKLKACEKFAGKNLKMPIYLVGTCGEEIGMLGAKFLIKSNVLNPKYVLVGEPSELAVIHAQKTYVVYQINIGYNQIKRDAKGFNTRMEMKCIGKSAHGSYPDHGDNAISKMLMVVRKIKEANFQLKLSRIMGGDSVNKVPDAAAVEFYITASGFEDFKRFYREKLVNESFGKQIHIEFGGLGETGIQFMPDNILDAVDEIKDTFDGFKNGYLSLKDDTYNPGHSTMNFGKLMQTASGVDLMFDFRVLPDINPEEFDKKLKAELAHINSRYPSLIMKATRVRYNPPLNMKPGSDLVEAAHEAQRSVGIVSGLAKKSTSTEAALYYSSGYDAIVFGPGLSMGNSHSPNEYNLMDQLEKAQDFYGKMIERFCL